MVRQAVPILHGEEPHVSIEYVATGEVQYGIGELVSRVVLQVHPMVQVVLEFAYSHVGYAGFGILMSRHS